MFAEPYTAQEARKMWTGLNQQYGAFRRKLKNASRSGVSANRPTFRHEEAMNFLRGTDDVDEK